MLAYSTDFLFNNIITRLDQKDTSLSLISLPTPKQMMTYYETKKPHIVIIDYDSPESKELLQHIIEINPHQRTIIVSSEPKPSCTNGCDFCASNYSRRRFSKPIAFGAFIATLHDFDTSTCMYYRCFSGDCAYFSKILDFYDYLHYDEPTRTLTHRNSHLIASMLECREFFLFLDAQNIHYRHIGKDSYLLTFPNH